MADEIPQRSDTEEYRLKKVDELYYSLRNGFNIVEACLWQLEQIAKPEEYLDIVNRIKEEMNA